MNSESARIEIMSANHEQTRALARRIGEKLQEGDILALSGELGSGKTCFAGGVARGLGVGEKYQITSPTFTLINEYPARLKLYHFDVYRLNGYADLDDLGLQEILASRGVVIIEWAEKIREVLPDDAIFINFEYIDENKRKIIFNGLRKRLKELAIDGGY